MVVHGDVIVRINYCQVLLLKIFAHRDSLEISLKYFALSLTLKACYDIPSKTATETLIYVADISRVKN